ncbi:MAG: formylglycine-generating enzyme family protein [Planctomycetales bacterium]
MGKKQQKSSPDSQIETLRERLLAGVAAWTGDDNPEQQYRLYEFRLQWTGVGDGSDDEEPCVALVQYARAVGCNPNDETLETALRDLDAKDHRASAEFFWKPDNQCSDEQREELAAQSAQAANLMQGLVACVAAAVTYVEHGKKITDAVARKLAEAAEAYSNAWPFLGETPDKWSPPNHATSAARSILYSWYHKSNAPITTTTWLILQRLLAVLLDDEAASTPPEEVPGETNENRLLMLLYGSDGHGHVGPVTLLRRDEGAFGCYPDPLAFGITTVDEGMQQSLRLAWQIAEPRLLQQIGRTFQGPVTVRLVPEFPGWVMSLAGESAGGLLACGVLATAWGERLDSSRTASLAMELRNRNQGEETPPRNEPPSSLDQVTLVGVKHLKQKLEAAAKYEEPQIVAVAGDPGDIEEVLRKTNPAARPRLEAITSLNGLLEFLRGDERIEQVLRDYCDAVVKLWNRRRTDDRDREGLTHYIAPSLSKKVRDGKVCDTSEEEFQRKSTGDQTDAPAYEPLVSSETGDPEADEERQFVELFALGSRVIITEDAGAGKSVFTERLAAWCATPVASRAVLSEDRTLLPFRWEKLAHDWPTTRERFQKDLVTAITPFLKEVPSRPKRKNRSSQGPLPVTGEEVVSYALKHARVVLICDAFDQTNDRQREAFRQMTNWLTDECPGNRIIVTSRAQPYEDAKISTFPSIVWSLCRLDGFSAWRQFRYLRDLLEKLPAPHDMDGNGWALDRVTNAPPDQREERAKDLLQNEAVFGRLYDTIDQLLKVPVVLAFVRELANGQSKFPRFVSRADLYFQVTEKLFQRNLENQEKQKKVTPEIRKNTHLLRSLLTAVAIEMLKTSPESYVVQGNAAVTRLGTEVKGRLSGEAKRHFDKLWKLAEDLGEFTSHLLVEQKSAEYFGWKHRGIMEFYGGLHLCGAGTLELSNELGEHVGRIEWEWPWRFAIELAEISRAEVEPLINAEGFLHCLKTLFRRPRYHVRPNRLICRAWPWVLRQAELLTEGEFQTRGNRTSEFHDAVMAATRRVQRAVQQAVEEFVPSDGAERPAGGEHRDVGAEVVDGADFEAQAIERTCQLLDLSSVHAARGSSRSPASPNTQAELQRLAVGVLYQFLSEYPLLLRGVLPGDESVADNACAIAWKFERGFRRCPGPERLRPDMPLEEAEATDQRQAEWRELHAAAATGKDHPLFHCHLGDDSPFAYSNEKPKEEKVEGPFLLHQYPMTVRTYALFDPRHAGAHAADRFVSRDEDAPVNYVDQFDAWACSVWFGGCLPNEVQWEFACRAQRWNADRPPERTLWWFGVPSDEARKRHDAEPDKNRKFNVFDARVAKHVWFYQNADHPMPVTTKEAEHTNGWGLCEMSGNVYEWTSQRYAGDISDAWCEIPALEAAGFVVRGGSWRSNARSTRSSDRGSNTAVSRFGNIGFRVCRVSESPEPSSS